MIFLDFSKIPQNGEFFCKFIRGEKFAQSRFAEFSKIEDKQFLSHKAQNFPNRQIARWIIAETMQSLDLSEKQRENISQVSAANTLFVSTGQQVGFLGGALYTCLKIATAINIAKKLQQQHPEIQFIPIFWLEDNDHDAKESAEVYIFDANHHIRLFHPDYSTCENTPVSELVFDEKIEETLGEVIEALPYSQNKQELADTLRSIYTKGKRWTDAMLEFYQTLFKNEGLLFASAATARKSGAIARLAEVNFASQNSFEQLFDIFSQNRVLLENNGHTVNISIDYFNYCKHLANKRYSIRTVSPENSLYSINHAIHTYSEIVSDMHQNPADYSPKAILRPIFQEVCFPSAASVLGPGEISYFAMLKEAYEFFGVDFPPVSNRAMACFVPERHIHFLEQNGFDLAHFFEPANKFEQFLSSLVINDVSEGIFEQVKHEIQQNFSQLTDLLINADPSLVRTQESYAHKTTELIENLQKKYVAALKKKNADFIGKLRKIHEIILPNERLQERQISPINFINIYGFDNFSKILNEIADNYVKGFIVYT